jgi:sugar phosphate permease
LFLVFGRDKASGSWRVASRPTTAPLELSPQLVAIALMYFCVKLIRYSFLFWLPLYMTEALHYSPVHAGYASSMYELAGLAGIVLAGYLSDRFCRKSRFGVGAGMMMALAGFCVLFPMLGRAGALMNLVAIALIGAFTFGPDTLMVGAGVQDLVVAENAGRAAGFVDGVGSIGQLASPFLVSRLATAFGWDWLFIVLGTVSLLGALILMSQSRLMRVPGWVIT